MENQLAHGLTPSEQFVAKLSEQAFLKLWTHPNPKGKKGKELADCLIVCGAHIIIISVKEIEYKETDDPKTGWERWLKAAIDKSSAQIWGAERWLSSSDEICRHDGRIVTLPPRETRKYHRISVSLGGQGKTPLKWGDFGNGFVHVYDEVSLTAIFNALDTITDFVNFISACEAFIRGGCSPIFADGGVESLLVLYFNNGCSLEFDDKPDMLVVTDDLWVNYVKSKDYQEIRHDLRNSYYWDNLIEFYARDLLTDGLFDMQSKQVTKNELALVQMALQPRGHRANLAEAFLEFLQNPNLKTASRVVLGYEQTAFVFLVGSSDDREFRMRELSLRCLVVRGIAPNVTTVVGIATDRPQNSKIGYSSDIAYLHIDKLTTQDKEQISQIQNELGFFKNARWSNNT